MIKTIVVIIPSLILTYYSIIIFVTINLIIYNYFNFGIFIKNLAEILNEHQNLILIA